MKQRFKFFWWSAVITALMILFSKTLLSAGWLFLLEVSAHYVFMILAALFLVLRFAAFIGREHFIYILVGTINLGMGIGAFFYYWGHVNPGLPLMMSVNFALGAILLVDAVLLKRKVYEQNLSPK